NYAEAVRLLQARQAQFQFASEIEKGINQVLLASLQYLAGDAASARATAEQARNTLEPLHKDQQDKAIFAANLSQNYAVLGNKELALKEAERAVTLLPSAKDQLTGPALEENLALIQTIFGENSRAISTLTRLLQTPYGGLFYGIPVTPALLRLDPLWDPLRADPAPKTFRGKATVNSRSIFSELMRRNVYKVAVTYAVVGWLLIQVATQVFPFMEIPNWAIRLVIFVTALGFPVALIIAWAFELTPEGIKRTEDADAARQRSKSRAWIYVALIGAAISVALFS